MVFWKDGGNESWMEIKTSHYSELKDDRQLDKNKKNTWNNKPKEQYNRWQKDIEKLQTIKDSNITKFFVLVEQCDEISLWKKIISEKKYENYQFWSDLNDENDGNNKFDLIWKKAPVNKCIIRIFNV